MSAFTGYCIGACCFILGMFVGPWLDELEKRR